MEATFVDLRTKSTQILDAIRRKEPVTLSYRGEKVAVIEPIADDKGKAKHKRMKASEHPAVGM